MKSIQPGQLYKHYKGDTYKIITLAQHSENKDWLVVYERVTNIVGTGQRVWARPLSMFLENVEVEGYKGPRFEYTKE
jgi:hypothetical protein